MIYGYNLMQYDYDVETFHLLVASKASTKDQILQQTKMVVEESEELKAEIDMNVSGENILKEACDVLYVALGFMQKLEKAGFDIRGAMKVIADNNLSKFIKNDEDTQERLNNTVEKYRQKGIDTYVSYDENNDVYCVRHSVNHKVMKPYGYVTADVSEFVPKEHKNGLGLL